MLHGGLKSGKPRSVSQLGKARSALEGELLRARETKRSEASAQALAVSPLAQCAPLAIEAELHALRVIS